MWALHHAHGRWHGPWRIVHPRTRDLPSDASAGYGVHAVFGVGHRQKWATARRRGKQRRLNAFGILGRSHIPVGQSQSVGDDAGLFRQLLAAASLVFSLINLPSIAVWAVMGARMGHYLQVVLFRRIFNWTMALLLVASMAASLFMR